MQEEKPTQSDSAHTARCSTPCSSQRRGRRGERGARQQQTDFKTDRHSPKAVRAKYHRLCFGLVTRLPPPSALSGRGFCYPPNDSHPLRCPCFARRITATSRSLLPTHAYTHTTLTHAVLSLSLPNPELPQRFVVVVPLFCGCLSSVLPSPHRPALSCPVLSIVLFRRLSPPPPSPSPSL